MKGIDISYYQGNIDFVKVKNQIKFAIIRVGLGDNIASQDDVKYKEYIDGCVKNGIPYAFYLISYAKRLTGSESVDSEIAHMDRIAKQYKPFAIFYDLEIYEKLGKETLTSFACRFCDYFKNKGYKTGVYANLNWYRNYLDYNTLKNKGYIIWLAHYGVDKPGLPCDIWQYSDKGHLDGINTNTTDMNIMYTNIINQPTPKPQPTKPKIDIYYAVKTKEDGWLPEVKNLTDYAGNKNHKVIGIRMRVSRGSIRYRITTVSGKQLSWITKSDIKDYINGYAGNNTPIATVEAEYLTPKDIINTTGYQYLKYKVNNYSYQIDLSKKNGMDGYAGKKGVACTKFQAYID